MKGIGQWSVGEAECWNGEGAICGSEDASFEGIEEASSWCGNLVKFAEEGDVNMQERTLLLSSMNVVMMETERKLSSPKSPARTRCLARLFSAACRGARTWLKTRAAKMEDRGHH